MENTSTSKSERKDIRKAEADQNSCAGYDTHKDLETGWSMNYDITKDKKVMAIKTESHNKVLKGLERAIITIHENASNGFVNYTPAEQLDVIDKTRLLLEKSFRNGNYTADEFRIMSLSAHKMLFSIYKPFMSTMAKDLLIEQDGEFMPLDPQDSGVEYNP